METKLIDCCYFHPLTLTSISHKESCCQSITAHINITAVLGWPTALNRTENHTYCNTYHNTDHIFCSVLPGNTYDRSFAVDGEEANILLYDIWEQVS